MVNKSPKVYKSSHDGLQNFLTSTLLNIGPTDSQRGNRVAGTRPFHIVYTCNIKNKQLSSSFQVNLEVYLKEFRK